MKTLWAAAGTATVLATLGCSMSDAATVPDCGGGLAATSIGDGTPDPAFDPSQPQAAGYKMTFDDEFAKLELASKGTSPGDYTWCPGLWYQPDKLGEARVSNGVLTLSDAELPSMSKDGRHGRDFLFGYFEAELRYAPLDKPDPQHPGVASIAWWLYSSAGSFRGAYPFSELDIQEDFGPSTFTGTVHEWVGAPATDPKSRTVVRENDNTMLPGKPDQSQWHTYGMLWEKGQVTYYFDRRKVQTVKTFPINDVDPVYAILSAQTHMLQVAWVHVWQRRPTCRPY
jgi:hypothetical protein